PEPMPKPTRFGRLWAPLGGRSVPICVLIEVNLHSDFGIRSWAGGIRIAKTRAPSPLGSLGSLRFRSFLLFPALPCLHLPCLRQGKEPLPHCGRSPIRRPLLSYESYIPAPKPMPAVLAARQSQPDARDAPRRLGSALCRAAPRPRSAGQNPGRES